MTTNVYVLNLIAIIMIILQCCSSVSIKDIPYSVSPDGQLSILGSLSKIYFQIGRHPNDSTEWPLLLGYETPLNGLWGDQEVYNIDIDPDLSSINHVIAVDSDRFIYVSIIDEYTCEIGIVKITWHGENEITLEKLNVQELDVETEYTLLAYDIQLGFDVYFISKSHFVIYNFETFNLRMIDWHDTTNMTIINVPLCLIIIDRTHVLILSEIVSGVNDEDEEISNTALALAEIDFNSTQLDMYIISYEIILVLDNNGLPAEASDDMSMAVNKYGDILIGLPDYHTVVFAYLNSSDWQLTLRNRTFSGNDTWRYFGYSVAWLPDQRQFAVNAHKILDDSGTHSLILFFNFDDDELWVRGVFPNNQQLSPTYLTSFDFYDFILLHGTYFGFMASFSAHDIIHLILLPASSGTVVFDSDSFAINRFPYIFGIVRPCSLGTYKNDKTSISPCILCPAGTKAPKYDSEQCEACSKPLNCPLGSIDDQIDYPRILQIVTYPESSDSTSFDDIILSNIFSFDCLLLSPIFWMFMVITIVTVFFIIINIFSLFTRMLHYRLRIIRIFKHVDLVGEGHLWIGGLVSCGILVLIVFATLFSLKYTQLYPIEQIKYSSSACNRQIYNAKFTSGLQLLALPKSDDERPMFELLDEQPFNLTLNLINTLINCLEINVEQTTGGKFTNWPLFGCSTDDKNATVTLVLPLPSHLTVTTIHLPVIYPVGSVRVCLQGRNKTTSDNRYQLRELIVCEIFSDANHSMRQNAEFDITLTKVINRTEPFESGELPIYSGLWIPMITSQGATTKFIWMPGQDDFRRTLSYSSAIVIGAIESQFYIQNKQEPIARTFEIVFHNVLFIGVILELFTLIFLISRLIILPIIRMILNWFNKCYLFDQSTSNSDHMKPNTTTKITIIDIDKTRV